MGSIYNSPCVSAINTVALSEQRNFQQLIEQKLKYASKQNKADLYSLILFNDIQRIKKYVTPGDKK